MRRSPLPGSNSANLTDELPELNTSTRLPAAEWPELTAIVGVLGMLIGVTGTLDAVAVADPE
jgi:cell division protein FtsX